MKILRTVRWAGTLPLAVVMVATPCYALTPEEARANAEAQAAEKGMGEGWVEAAVQVQVEAQARADAEHEAWVEQYKQDAKDAGEARMLGDEWVGDPQAVAHEHLKERLGTPIENGWATFYDESGQMVTQEHYEALQAMNDAKIDREVERMENEYRDVRASQGADPAEVKQQLQATRAEWEQIKREREQWREEHRPKTLRSLEAGRNEATSE